MSVHHFNLSQETEELEEALFNMGFSDVYIDTANMDEDDCKESVEENEKIFVEVRFHWTKEREKKVNKDGRKEFTGENKKSVLEEVENWLEEIKRTPDPYFKIVLK